MLPRLCFGSALFKLLFFCSLLVRETATIVMLGCLLASGLVWLLLLVLSNLQCVLEPSLRGAAGTCGFPSYVRFFHHYFLKYFSFLSIAVRMLPCAMLFSLHNYWVHYCFSFMFTISASVRRVPFSALQPQLCCFCFSI